MVMRAQHRARADSNRLRLVRGPSPVQAVFEMCGLMSYLPFLD
jgi:hypothetical protein